MVQIKQVKQNTNVSKSSKKSPPQLQFASSDDDSDENDLDDEEAEDEELLDEELEDEEAEDVEEDLENEEEDEGFFFNF